MKLKDFIVDLLFAPKANCLGCGSVKGSDENWLCSECAVKLSELSVCGNVYRICSGCGEVLTGSRCRECGNEDRFYRAAAAYEYDEPVKGLIASFKFRGAWRIAEWMGGEISRAVNEAGLNDFDAVTFVPLHNKREKQRGFNQARLLAERISAISGKPCIGILKRMRHTKQQAKLTASERRKNLLGAFECVEQINGGKMLLIDDVRSTGSTCIQCAEQLIKSGASDVYIATFAAAKIHKNAEPHI